MGDFVSGTQARLFGLKGEAALNGQSCVSLGSSGTNGRILVRLSAGRELAVRPENLGLAGAAGTLPIGCRVTIIGLAKAVELNGQEGTIVGHGATGSGRVLVDVNMDGEPKSEENEEAKEEAKSQKAKFKVVREKQQAKSLKLENLVLVQAEASEKEPVKEGEGRFDLKSDKEKKEIRKKQAAITSCPLGSRVRIDGLVEENNRDNTGDPALNGQEGIVERPDFDEPGRLIIRLPPIKKHGLPSELRWKSISFENLICLDLPKKADEKDSWKRKQEAGDSTELAMLGPGGKRCKTTEIAVAGADKVAAQQALFASQNRNRDVRISEFDTPADHEAARSNALIYARTDVLSGDDEVAGAAMGRLVQLCPRFAMKATCALGVDIAANGSGKIGSKSSDVIEKLAEFLSGGEVDGILRKEFKEGQAFPVALEPDAIAACKRCVERGLKGGRLLKIFRANAGNIKDFVGRGCKER
eukprot:TRINITY_DN75989_c0_g1_i1.p1 TRINITY_DN75989_c0_g1~~TRINITY_DN75989_c0_g1_i1.p1  ORF type:complete len:471 (-),score=73.26 TRINITY_DN75989_c0_g1_i1:65-1477(-)